MKKAVKKMRASILFVLGGVMAVITVGVVVYMITFLLSELNSALNIELPEPAVERFDTEGFEKLDLVQ